MSKAVLVINMPKDCYECKLQDWLTCRIAKKCNTSHSRPDWCPLRELPEYKEEKHTSDYSDIKNEGYNACIDDILGDKE